MIIIVVLIPIVCYDPRAQSVQAWMLLWVDMDYLLRRLEDWHVGQSPLHGNSSAW